MSPDINTLFLVTVDVEAILGLLLYFVWVQNTATRAVGWWGSAHLLRAGSILLFGLFGQWPDVITIDLSNAILLVSFAVTWTGTRVFDGRRPNFPCLFAGAAAWLLLVQIPAVATSSELRSIISASIVAIYTWLAAAELWRGRGENLLSRLPATFMLFAHGSLFLLRTPLAFSSPAMSESPLAGSVWMTVLSIEALLFTISISFILLAMTKERSEQHHKQDAIIDPLTGVVNRRGFFAEAAEKLGRFADKPHAVAVLLVDLDHFKNINDRFGHPVGDKVLRLFGAGVKAMVRNTDIVGRLGGEEFAVILDQVGRERACFIADQIRWGFAEAADQLEGLPIHPTLSIGVALHDGPMFDLPLLLTRADHALYRAKEAGRNRVEVADERDWERMVSRPAQRSAA
jgi:diguanylate cyclase (GGDEF)-like protein